MCIATNIKSVGFRKSCQIFLIIHSETYPCPVKQMLVYLFNKLKQPNKKSQSQSPHGWSEFSDNPIETNTDSVTRRGWDSNPRDPFEPTHFPGVLLRPLGHLSCFPLLLIEIEKKSLFCLKGTKIGIHSRKATAFAILIYRSYTTG